MTPVGRVSIEKKPKQRLAEKTTRQLGKLPRLETLLEGDGDPLASVQYVPNDVEASANAEMSEILRQIRERRRSQRELFRTVYDNDYFVVLCFQSRQQRNEFLAKSGWGEIDERYLNGLEICRLLGIDVRPIPLSPLKLRGKPKKYSAKEVL